MTNLQKNVLDCTTKGMSIKETAAMCGCTESTVGHIRVNKALWEEYNKSVNDSIKETIIMSLEDMKLIVGSPSASINMKIAASKQLVELIKLNETVFPAKQDITVRVIYPE